MDVIRVEKPPILMHRSDATEMDTPIDAVNDVRAKHQQLLASERLGANYIA